MFEANWAIPVTEAGAYDCRWPTDMESKTWQITTHYCGRPVLDGKRYCGEHHKRVYSAVPSGGWIKRNRHR